MLADEQILCYNPHIRDEKTRISLLAPINYERKQLTMRNISIISSSQSQSQSSVRCWSSCDTKKLYNHS